MLSSHVKGRDADGYSDEGVDVVPERKGVWRPIYQKEEQFHAGKIVYSLARLVELLQEANKRTEELKDKVEALTENTTTCTPTTLL